MNEKDDKMVEEVKEKRYYGYSSRKGEEISVYFLDGKMLKGKLLKSFKYEIILEVEKGNKLVEVTIFKAAIKYII